MPILLSFLSIASKSSSNNDRIIPFWQQRTSPLPATTFDRDCDAKRQLVTSSNNKSMAIRVKRQPKPWITTQSIITAYCSVKTPAWYLPFQQLSIKTPESSNKQEATSHWLLWYTKKSKTWFIITAYAINFWYSTILWAEALDTSEAQSILKELLETRLILDTQGIIG